MKSRFIIFFLCLFSYLIFSQNTFGQKRGDQFFKTEIVRLLERLNNDTNQYQIINALNRIGTYYDSLNQHERAMHYYRLAVTTGEFDVNFRKRTFFKPLAINFLKLKQYDSLLYYYHFIKKLKPIRVIRCGNGLYRFFADFDYWQMAALDGIGYTDSAIKVFMPHAFYDWTNNEGTEFSTEHLYDNDYHCQMMDFLRILQKKYSYWDIYADVRKFTDSANYNPLKVFEHNSCIYKLNFSLTLRDYSYNLYGWDEHCHNLEVNKEAIRNHFLEIAIREIKNSFIYRYFLEEIAL